MKPLMTTASTRRRSPACLLTTLFMLAVGTAGLPSRGPAQTLAPDADSALVAAVRTLPGSSLTLQRAVGLAIATSPVVRAASAVLDAARGAVRREGGAFDPVLSFGWDYIDQRLPSASFFAGADVLHTVQGTGTARVHWLSPLGTSIEGRLDAVRLTTNSGFAFLDPQYTTTGALTIRQPLLRGFITSARKGLTGAEFIETSARERYEQELLLLQGAVEQAYWDVYAGERDLAVQLLTRDRAAAFLEETRLRAQTGLVGPGQVANAASFLADQENLLLDREEALDAFSEKLVRVIGVRPDAGASRFKTADQPPDTIAMEDPDRWVREGLERNRDLRALRSEIDLRKTYSRAAAWEALPSLDLIGSVGGNGLGGDARDVVFGADTLRTSASGSLGDALRHVIRRDYPAWRVGVEISVPLGMRTGLGEQDRLDAEVVIAEQRYAQATRVLEEEIRAQCRELQNGSRRLRVARESVTAAREQARVVRIEYANGRSTAFELVRVAADVAVAEQRYSRARVRSAQAAAALRQLTAGSFGSGGGASVGE